MIAYLTDVEGRWDKLASFADANPLVRLDGESLHLADGVTFVFGGDAVDRGPASRRITRVLLAARLAYGDRVVLLAGNRDINKLRLARELTGSPPAGAPTTGTRGDLLRWILERTMGASKAFEFRAAELTAEGRPADDDAVVDSYLDEVSETGTHTAYLHACRLGYRHGATLFLHGGVTRENLGATPGIAERSPDIDHWLAALEQFYRAELAEFAAGRSPEPLIAYQAPLPGSRGNQTSVVYARPADELANPQLPTAEVVAQLRASGIGRIVVGHTPSGDCPAIVRDGDFELVLADNSYGRLELGSHVALTDDDTHVRATTQLDDGTRAIVDYTLARRDQTTPLGRRDRATGQLVKARLTSGAYLLFRGLPQRRVEQLEASSEAVMKRDLVVAREPASAD